MLLIVKVRYVQRMGSGLEMTVFLLSHPPSAGKLREERGQATIK